MRKRIKKGGKRRRKEEREEEAKDRESKVWCLFFYLRLEVVKMEARRGNRKRGRKRRKEESEAKKKDKKSTVWCCLLSTCLRWLRRKRGGRVSGGGGRKEEASWCTFFYLNSRGGEVRKKTRQTGRIGKDRRNTGRQELRWSCLGGMKQ